MATYPNPIGMPNPFLTTPPIVLVARNVRVTPAGEVVVEDANNLKRFMMRADYHRVHPFPQVSAPTARNIPDCGMKKKAW